jgi:galactokinase/mevalonate kinase-like predicted kinase
MWFACSDPPRGRLGSGGGAAHILHQAWLATGMDCDFLQWLRQSQKAIIHGGGLSRRLPAYSSTGKPLIPIPAMRWDRGSRLDQSLLDMQAANYLEVLSAAPKNMAALIGSGDVLLHFGSDLPQMPEADVLLLGMKVPAETAIHFGVFVLSSEHPGELYTSLQKPDIEQLRKIAEERAYLVDSGMWLLSARAVKSIMSRCGWDRRDGSFRNGAPDPYDLYGEFGGSLGESPRIPEPASASLSCAVIELPNADFYHLGTNRQMIDSVCAMQNRGNSDARIFTMHTHPDQITQNSVFEPPIRRETNHTLWVENSHIPASWEISHEHVLTGIPDNQWHVRLEPGVCLDFAPISEEAFCIRPYGFDDPFRGAMNDAATMWFGRPTLEWFLTRNISLKEAAIDPDADIHDTPLFPVCDVAELPEDFISWLFQKSPLVCDEFKSMWIRSPRLSAKEIADRTNLLRLEEQRSQNRLRVLRTIYHNRHSSIFPTLDLQNAAKLWADGTDTIPPLTDLDDNAPVSWHVRMWRAAIARYRKEEYSVQESSAFACLREAILSAAHHEPVKPSCSVLSDQIVWARSPIRLDIAGGWTDTPPFCLQFGGKVVNVGLNLNGQPPVQVFARVSRKPEIVIRSIDLGAEERIETWEQLSTYATPGSEFALGKAGLALAGFSPEFHAEGSRFKSLRDMLEEFGGGIEISLLAAIPAGSGLGTSSILSATLLGALGELCGLRWDIRDLTSRTMILEQMLTTGGGWQDQVGGIFRGIKVAQTEPGMEQSIALHWLPEHIMSGDRCNREILLYYTGLTRMAKNILQEIVRGMFLNESHNLGTLKEIGDNVDFASDAITCVNHDSFGEAIRRSWVLNQRLDSGTNTPAIQAILEPIQDYLLGAKLGGAGGGGFLFMAAKDAEAGRRIRQELGNNPPNPRARFVDLSVSSTGLEITRS